MRLANAVAGLRKKPPVLFHAPGPGSRARLDRFARGYGKRARTCVILLRMKVCGVFCKMLKRLAAFWRAETVLCLALAAALVSMLFVPVDGAYPFYIDLRVLGLLFALMAVVQGLEDCGLFRFLSRRLLSGRRSLPRLVLLFTLLPFFLSMLVTNDVALIACVPFTFLALRQAGEDGLALRVCVLQTLAANLGSMATPIGNPQNLYLYSRYGLPAPAFFAVVLPLALASLALVSLGALLLAPRRTVEVALGEPEALPKKRLLAYGLLFLLCLLSVFRVLPVAIAAAAALLYQLARDRKLLKRVDYCLLLTFVCFFVFSGNLGRIEPVRSLLETLLGKNTLLCGVLTAQCISNVPAAILLSGFTADWRGLLAGVNLGGLGTPVASLASLISLKYYLREPNASPGRYLAVFTAANAASLLALLAVAFLLGLF